MANYHVGCGITGIFAGTLNKHCNDCKNHNCGYMPRVGQMVRYNCPFYKR
jgi:hypothetical protein